MATKKKVLLEQETPVPENTAPADGAISFDGTPVDAAAPPDSDDLNALLASMDQPNDSTATEQPDGDATLEGSAPPLEFMETEASDEAAPEDGGEASGAPSDLDEPAGSAPGEAGDGEEETPSNLSAESADGTPAETISETAVEPAPPKPKRAPRRKKARMRTLRRLWPLKSGLWNLPPLLRIRRRLMREKHPFQRIPLPKRRRR